VKSEKVFILVKAFKLPIIVLIGLILFLIFTYFKITTLAIVTALISILLGSWPLIKETYEDIKTKNFALDYIAILAVIVALITQEYLVGIVIALMLATGRTLEEYGASSAKKTLTQLADRIPHDILKETGSETQSIPVSQIKIDDFILVRKGEVIPLDGTLLSESGVIDESSLTGEAYPVDKLEGDLIRSGTINLSSPLRIKVINDQENSSYNKIVNLVQNAQKEKAPMVRLADKYSLWFTVTALVISAMAFLKWGTLESVLAVLVVATPCPLILATPIALMGGMNKSAKKRTIIKKLASIEVLSRVTTLVFDKTGTLTLGKPQVTKFEIMDNSLDKKEILSISAAIERNSLHPLAKSIVVYADGHRDKNIHASEIKEIIGKGIEGRVKDKKYSLTKISDDKSPDIVIGLYEKDNLIATFTIEDEIKSDTKTILDKLKNKGLEIYIFTGDKKEVAEKLLERLGLDRNFKAELKPEDKQKGVEELKNQGKVVAMVGDGINDAPALALADVGMVFSNEEQTAASEAADIVFLNGNFSSVLDSIQDANQTIKIAKQSIIWGIGMSVVAMILAGFGLIHPITGALIQEAIDVIVILNALRASK
jgi:heavy metal translocating P-type ATPase